ncbi:MAG: TRAP transporter substrate-binding protein [Candidatus Jordarchaeaceae archaeon]
MEKKLFLMISLIVLMLIFPQVSSSKILRINESLGPGSVEDTALQRFKQLVEEKTKGEVQIRIYLLDQLGSPTTSIENLMMGTLDLYSGALEYYEKLAPDELRIQSLLYMFRDRDHLRKYLKSPVFQKALDRILAQGIRFLSTEWNADRGPYRVFVCTKPIYTPDDLVGVKKRIWPSDVIRRGWEHLGTTPVILPWTETYLAIKQGMIHAVTSPLMLVRNMRFTEVAKYVTETREFMQTWPITISEKVWKQLTPTQQKILIDSANEAGKLYAKITYENAEQDIQAMMKETNAVFIRVNLEPFAKKMEPFYQKLIQEGYLKKEIYEAVQAMR